MKKIATKTAAKGAKLVAANAKTAPKAAAKPAPAKTEKPTAKPVAKPKAIISNIPAGAKFFVTGKGDATMEFTLFASEYKEQKVIRVARVYRRDDVPVMGHAGINIPVTHFKDFADNFAALAAKFKGKA